MSTETSGEAANKVTFTSPLPKTRGAAGTVDEASSHRSSFLARGNEELFSPRSTAAIALSRIAASGPPAHSDAVRCVTDEAKGDDVINSEGVESPTLQLSSKESDNNKASPFFEEDQAQARQRSPVSVATQGNEIPFASNNDVPPWEPPAASVKSEASPTLSSTTTGPFHNPQTHTGPPAVSQCSSSSSSAVSSGYRMSPQNYNGGPPPPRFLTYYPPPASYPPHHPHVAGEGDSTQQQMQHQQPICWWPPPASTGGHHSHVLQTPCGRPATMPSAHQASPSLPGHSYPPVGAPSLSGGPSVSQQQPPLPPPKQLAAPRSLAPYSQPETVTPTPSAKRQKTSGEYSRKKKSLGVLAETFCKKHEHSPRGTEVVIDLIAKDFGVERRRIYDVINIFEAVKLVVKKAKNTYEWMGTDHLPLMFALLQRDAICQYPNDAIKAKLVESEAEVEREKATEQGTGLPKKRVTKSLSRLSQQFLQVFLVGNEVVSLADASDKIHGTVTTVTELASIGSQGSDVPKDPGDLKRMAAKGLKTKIRRLYDIANVFHAIGYLEKVDDYTGMREFRRPFYRWTYRESFMEIRKLGIGCLSPAMKRAGCPFAGKVVGPASSPLATSVKTSLPSVDAVVSAEKNPGNGAAEAKGHTTVLANINQNGALVANPEPVVTGTSGVVGDTDEDMSEAQSPQVSLSDKRTAVMAQTFVC